MDPIILYNNKLESSTLEASSEASGFNIDYLKNSKTYSYWKPNITGNATITIDLGSAKLIGALGIANHNLGSINASISLSKSNDGTNWKPQIENEAILSDSAILRIISDSNNAAQYINLEYGGLIELEAGGYLESENSDANIFRYWKLEIETTGTPELAVLYLGDYIKFEYPPESPTVPIEESIKAISERSNEGHLLETDIRYFPAVSNHTYKNITRSWYASDFLHFWNNHAKQLKPFFYAWDLTNRPSDVYLAKIANGSVRREPLTVRRYVNEINLNLEILA